LTFSPGVSHALEPGAGGPLGQPIVLAPLTIAYRAPSRVALLSV
jgi:hypothetical protein